MIEFEYEEKTTLKDKLKAAARTIKETGETVGTKVKDGAGTVADTAKRPFQAAQGPLQTISEPVKRNGKVVANKTNTIGRQLSLSLDVCHPKRTTYNVNARFKVIWEFLHYMKNQGHDIRLQNLQNNLAIYREACEAQVNKVELDIKIPVIANKPASISLADCARDRYAVEMALVNPNAKIGLLNMANAKYPGGNWLWKTGGDEEALCNNSLIVLNLLDQLCVNIEFYPLLEFIFSKLVYSNGELISPDVAPEVVTEKTLRKHIRDVVAAQQASKQLPLKNEMYRLDEKESYYTEVIFKIDPNKPLTPSNSIIIPVINCAEPSKGIEPGKKYVPTSVGIDKPISAMIASQLECVQDNGINVFIPGPFYCRKSPITASTVAKLYKHALETAYIQNQSNFETHFVFSVPDTASSYSISSGAFHSILKKQANCDVHIIPDTFYNNTAVKVHINAIDPAIVKSNDSAAVVVPVDRGLRTYTPDHQRYCSNPMSGLNNSALKELKQNRSSINVGDVLHIPSGNGFDGKNIQLLLVVLPNYPTKTLDDGSVRQCYTNILQKCDEEGITELFMPLLRDRNRLEVRMKLFSEALVEFRANNNNTRLEVSMHTLKPESYSRKRILQSFNDDFQATVRKQMKHEIEAEYTQHYAPKDTDYLKNAYHEAIENQLNSPLHLRAQRDIEVEVLQEILEARIEEDRLHTISTI